MRAEEQAQQAEAQITMFELLRSRYFLAWINPRIFAQKPRIYKTENRGSISPSNENSDTIAKQFYKENWKSQKCLLTFNQIIEKVADPADAAHHCHHDAALSAGFLSAFSFPYYFQIILISRIFPDHFLIILTILYSLYFSSPASTQSSITRPTCSSQRGWARPQQSTQLSGSAPSWSSWLSSPSHSWTGWW